MMSNTDEHFGAFFHGMMTFDYFAIVKAVRTQAGVFEDFADWRNVEFPLALVVFRQREDPDPND
jgi:hypothetical protein